MPTPINPERYKRHKDAIEAALRDGFAPYRQSGGKGSCTTEATRRLREMGFDLGRNALNDFVRTQEKWASKGIENWLPDWNLYSEPGVEPCKVKRGEIHRWILTSAQDDTDVHQRFWANLQAYAQYLGAKLVVAGFTYQQVRHTDRLTLTKTYRPELRDHLRFEPLDCGSVLFCAEMNTLPTAVRPLSGLLTYSRGRDAVFPHAKLAYQTVPQAPGDYVPSVMTTGAVTVPNYIQKKAGLKAEFHHVLGATIVEVRGGFAGCRQISATSDGAFQDLDAKVFDGRVTRGHRVKAVTFGDIHLPSVDPHIYKSLWGRNSESLIDALKPEYQFFHDLLSFENWSRHVKDDPIYRARMVYRGLSEMEKHVSEAAAFLKDTQRDFCRSIDVESNHNTRLEQWARQTCDRNDTENYLFWLRCNMAMIEAERDMDEGFNLYRWAVRRSDSQSLPGVEFLPIGSTFKICQEHGGIECAMHGHEGPNGSRGSAVGLSKMAAKINIGDKHSPEILDGVYIAGMTGNLDQGYNTGPSSWRRAHIITYDNGKRTLVTQDEAGDWRA